jgi:hypothetical protein
VDLAIITPSYRNDLALFLDLHASVLAQTGPDACSRTHDERSHSSCPRYLSRGSQGILYVSSCHDGGGYFNW